MKRTIAKHLLGWKTRTRRKPLIVRGARQVGKTWSIEEFGRTTYPGGVRTVDFEKHPKYRHIFDRNLVPARILSELGMEMKRKIDSERELLFFDEVQCCPRAIMALRYLYEDVPNLHVIAAGSLLEFALQDISFPVGRVQFLNMHPMTFEEYLQATGNEVAAEILREGPKHLSESVHSTLLNELRQYLFVGGMPEAVRVYADTENLQEAMDVQTEIVHAFQEDFAKYRPRVDAACLAEVWATLADSVGSQIQYTKLTAGFSRPTARKAFDLLCLSRVIRKVRVSKAQGLPLGHAGAGRRFKALMVDIGIMQALAGISTAHEYAKEDILSIHHGAMAEQFVGQELVAKGDTGPFYWARQARSSSAEVDFLIQRGAKIAPIEVKSGPAGRLRSLHLLLKEHPDCLDGIVLSSGPYAELPQQRLRFVPLYYAGFLDANLENPD